MEKLSSLTHQESIRNYQVSKNVKVLTFIGILYLPAGLIAVSILKSMVNYRLMRERRPSSVLTWSERQIAIPTHILRWLVSSGSTRF